MHTLAELLMCNNGGVLSIKMLNPIHQGKVLAIHYSYNPE